jgi:Ca2+-binding RTX toxin-like protein
VGILLSGHRLEIVNTGTISGSADAIVMTTEDMFGVAQLANSGTINGDVVGGDGTDTVTNTGIMRGDVRLGFGNDVFESRSGLFAGSLDLGHGDDIAQCGLGSQTIEGGAGDDSIDGGAGIDTVVFDDFRLAARVDLRITGAQNTGYGVDTLVNIENVVTGGASDRVIGTAGDNVIATNDGNDTLEGGLGNDVLNGGADNDTAVFTGSVGATVDLTKSGRQSTGYGSDTLIGIESLVGTARNDRFTGNALSNTLTGGLGDDVLNGGAGIDAAAFVGSTGVAVDLNRSLQVTSNGRDTLISIEDLIGTSGGDRFTGNAVANRFLGGAGNDSLLGGSGNDVLQGGAGNDRLEGGAGTDTADYSDVKTAINVNLALGKATGHGTDVLASIENVIGGAGADRLTGGSGANRLTGGAGNDVLQGGGGNDVLEGDVGGAANGVDTADYSYVRTGLTIFLADNVVRVSEQDVDTLISIEAVIGGSAGDRIEGTESFNRLDGGAGNDTLVAFGGQDTLIGGLGDDRLDGGDLADTVDFASANASVAVDLATGIATGQGRDTLVAIENATGGRFDDRLTGNAQANTLRGGSGQDILTGADGSDRLEGDAGNDLLRGDGGIDVLIGGAGDDRLEGGEGFDYADFSTATVGVTVDLGKQGLAQNTGDGLDIIIDMEGLTGGRGNDTLTGSAAFNEIYGEDGNDVLIGKGSADHLHGRGGADIYRYLSVQDSGLTDETRDTIFDFVRGADRIDLSAIDANTASAGVNDAFYSVFSFDAFPTEWSAGQLFLDTRTNILYGNVDGDADAEFSIRIMGSALSSIQLSDFIV